MRGVWLTRAAFTQKVTRSRDKRMEPCSRGVRVAVVGAGVSGLSVALCLCESYGRQLELSVIADKYSPDTTSDRAGAIFIPSANYIPG